MKHQLKITALTMVCASFIFNCTLLTAQSSTVTQIYKAINYSAVALDAQGSPVANQNISIRASILRASQSGTVDWVERFEPTTNADGYFEISVGAGNRTGGACANFQDIDWAQKHYLRIEMDITGGNNFAWMETEEFTSVPYALRAMVADSLAGINIDSLMTAILTSVPYAQHALVADSLTGISTDSLMHALGDDLLAGINKDSLLRAILLSGTCSCTLQSAYDNGNTIFTSINSTGGGTPVAIYNTNPATSSGTNLSLLSDVFATAGNACAAYFDSRDNFQNTVATVIVSTQTSGDGIYMAKYPPSTNTNPFPGAALQIDNFNDHSPAIDVNSNGIAPAFANPGFPAVKSLMNGGAEAGYFRINNATSIASAVRGEIPTSPHAGAGEFLIGAAANDATALKAETDGLGLGLTVLTNNSANTNAALQVSTNGSYSGTVGTGGAATFGITNTNSQADDVFTDNLGLGRGMVVRNYTVANANDAFSVIHRGLGVGTRINLSNAGNTNPALFSQTLGKGKAGYFWQRNTSTISGIGNFDNALEVYNQGMGRTALLWNDNTSSLANVLEVNGRGTGNLIKVFNGTSGATVNPTALVNIINNNTAGPGLSLESYTAGSQIGSINYSVLGGTNVFRNQGIGATNTVMEVFQNGPGRTLDAYGNGTIVRAITQSIDPNDNALYAQSPNLSSANYAGYIAGNMIVTNDFTVIGVKNAIVKDAQGAKRLLNCEESTENWFTDYGTGQLTNGTVTINFDAVFLSTVNTNETYHVFIQLEDDCNGSGVKVINKTATSFTVSKLADGNNCNASFSYRITAKRKGFESLRLATESQENAASYANLQAVWPEVITRMQQVTNQVSQNLPNSTSPTSVPALQPSNIYEPATGTTPVPAIAPMTVRNYPASPTPNITHP